MTREKLARLNVREIRKSLGLTQAEFADRFLIPKRTVENWERGASECPIYTKKLLAEAVGFEINEKRWVLIDDCTSSKAAVFDEDLKAETQVEAVAEARREWDRLTAYDKMQRDAFYVAYTERDEDGMVDLDKAEIVVKLR